MELNEHELRLVIGGLAVEESAPKGEGFIGRELGRIQNELPFGASRGDAIREWNQRNDDYKQQQNNPGRYFDWLSKQPIG